MSNPNTPETLGSLMKLEGESESSAAARAYANSSVPGTPLEDLSDENLRSLKKYGRSHLSSNPYGPEDNEEDAPGLETGVLSQQLGFVRSLAATNPTVETSFVESATALMRVANSSKIALGNMVFTKNSLVDNPPGTLTGHTLLASEAPSGQKSPIPRNKNETYYVEPEQEENRPLAQAALNSLKLRNVYHPSNESPFISYAEKGEGALSNGMYSIQRELGVFDKNAERFSIAELRQVAGEILLKAQSINTTDAQTAVDQFGRLGRFGAIIDKLAITPHATQTGQGQVDVGALRARLRKAEKVLDFSNTGQDELLLVQSFATKLGVGGGDPFIDTLTKADTASSYGTLNSPAEPFAGPFPAGMAMPVLFALVILGLVGNFILPLAIDQLRNDEGNSIRDPEAPQTMNMGRNFSQSSNILNRMLELFGFPRMEGAGFFSPFMAGLMTFFGLSGPIGVFDTFAPDLVNSMINLLFAPGYYLVIVKGILRDVEVITNAFSNVNASSVFGAITSFFVAVEAVLGSFTFKFFMTMAKTGQQVMKGLYQPGRDAHGVEVATYDAQKNTSKEILTGRNRLRYSRIHESPGSDAAFSPLSLRTHMAAWLSNEIHASLGTNLLSAAGNGEGKAPESLGPHVAAVHGEGVGADSFKAAVTRLTPEQVKYVEEVIDSEYVPFSIQDVRTNEIFSMPAFIVSFSDDYSVNHGTSHGYGRTDPVYSYAKTVRSINLVFEMIAMNKEDHDYLYILLNKIVAMCYPQRDGGLIRKNAAGDQFFTQPFSQAPTASPVVRIRLGDLVASNKSRTAMENVFGGRDVLTLKNKKKTDNIPEEALKLTAQRRETLVSIGLHRSRAKTEFKVGLAGDGTTILIPANTTIAVETKEGFLTFRSQLDLRTNINGKRDFVGTSKQVTLTKPDPAATATKETLYQVDFEEVCKSTQTAFNFGGKTLAAALKQFKDKTTGLLDPMAMFGDGDIAGALKAYIKTSTPVKFFDEDIIDQFTNTDRSIKTLDDVKTFLDSETNPIVRSFEQGSPGRGLAGVITQLSLSFEGSLWGTGDEARFGGNIAPQRIQVTLAFAPIHDAPLGLTSTGDLFAPAYPVGPYSQRHLDGPKLAHETKFKELLNKKTNVPADDDLKDPTEPKLPF